MDDWHSIGERRNLFFCCTHFVWIYEISYVNFAVTPIVVFYERGLDGEDNCYKIEMRVLRLTSEL